MKHFSIILFIILAVATTSCDSRDVGLPCKGNNRIAVGISRASDDSSVVPAPDGSTFRFLLYSSKSTVCSHTKTYIYNTALDADYLVAALLDNQGNFQDIDASDGLSGLVGTFGTMLASPGVEIADNSVNGTLYSALVTSPNRVGNNGEDLGALYINESEDIHFGYFNIIKISNPLKDIRSKISFEIVKNQSITDPIQVNSIKLIGAGTGKSDERLYYYPLSRQCGVPAGVDNIMDFGTPDELTDAEGNPYFKSETKYILSGIYAPRNVTAAILGIPSESAMIIDRQYLSLQLQFTQGSVNVDTEMLLNAVEGYAELLSHRDYTFRIELASSYIKIYLSVTRLDDNEWQNPEGSGDASITKGEYVCIGTFKRTDWTVDDLEQEIK